jgi:NADH:ubiquinone oxidoreductase subunit K
VSIDSQVLAVAAVFALVAIGLYALLTVRNVIKLLIGLQILAKAAILSMVIAGRVSGQPALGQSLAVTIIVADTVVAIVGLALAVQIRQRFGTLDIRALARLHG